MWFQWFIFVFDLLIPVLMILSGKAMQNHCPKNINGMIGYRTPRSMKNMDTWKYAHEYCGGLLRRIMAENRLLNELSRMKACGNKFRRPILFTIS